MTNRNKPRSPLAAVVLALLDEAPMHVYRMHELIRQRRKDAVVNVAQRNSLYQTIDRLQRTGLVQVQQTLRDTARPERVVYEVTDEGRVALQDWLHEMLRAPAREFPTFPVALAMLPKLSPKEAKRELEHRVQALQGQIVAVDDELNTAAEMGLPRLFVVESEYQRAILTAELEWTQGLVDALACKELSWTEAWLRKIAAKFNSGSETSR